MNYIYDLNNQIHIVLKNHENSFCFYLVVLQRLQSSPTLKSYLDKNIDDYDIKQLLEPVKIYAKANKYNMDEISNEISNWFESDYTKNEIIQHKGYDDNLLFRIYYAPIIFYLVDNNIKIFLRIMYEISIYDSFFINSKIDMLQALHFIKNHDNFITNYYIPFYEKFLIEDLNFYNKKFIITSMSIWPNKDHSYGGHVITLLFGNENMVEKSSEKTSNIYIIDDERGIFEFAKYFKLQLNIYEIVIQNSEESLFKKLKSVSNMDFYKSLLHIKAKLNKSIGTPWINKKIIIIFIISFIFIVFIIVIIVVCVNKYITKKKYL